jgi:YidC/Oxa1 family membrane protein insertase
MGVMFYRVPAGLCVYFISSSLWGVGERKLLEFWKKKHPPKVAPPESPTAEGEKQRALASIPGNKVAARAGEAAGSFWKKLLDAADHAGADGMSGSKTTASRRKDLSGGKKNGKRRG